MTRARMVPVVLLTALVLVTALLVTGGEDDAYHLKIRLDNAGGLRDGSAVSLGGVRVGVVGLTLGDDDKVLVDVKIDRDKGPVPKDAAIGISAVNFLGQKQISIVGGDRRHPAPDGYVVPASRVTTSTDLDQVLGTLDTDTRARLTILVNEAGGAVVGRKWDIRQVLEQVPPGLAELRQLLEQLVRDNRTLGNLIVSSDRFVSQTNAKRADLVKMIDVLGQTSTTVAAKRAELRATLAKAPGTLATLQRFLRELEATTVPLGPAARQITAAAPQLTRTLAEVDPFRKAADPTLRTATSLAPTLSRLGREATPVVRRAQPAVRSLASLGSALVPVTNALDGSADNLVAVLENWSRAIQLRDGVGHIFRGEATFSPDALLSLLDRMGGPTAPSRKAKAKPKGKGKPAAAKGDAPAAPAPATGRPAGDIVKKAKDGVDTTVTGATQSVQDLIQKLVPSAAPLSGAGKDGAATEGLLDFLLRP